MSSTGRLRAGTPGTAESEVVEYTATRAADSTVDMTTCTGASVSVARPNGTSATWAFTVASATASAVVLRHVVADGDCPVIGSYRCRPTLDFPDGTRRWASFVLTVENW